MNVVGRGLVAAVIALLFLGFAPPHGSANGDDERDGSIVLPLRFRVASMDGRPVVSDAWLATQISEANRVFAPARVSFESVGSDPLPEQHARLVTRHDCHQLGRHLEHAVVNVFIVASMVDVDDGATPRRGVHWQLPWRSRDHWVVLTSIGPRTTLAHELGHYFGNRSHSQVAGNIMSYDHGAAPAFDDLQLRRVDRSVREQLRRRLVSIGRYRELVAEGRLPRLMYPDAAAEVQRSRFSAADVNPIDPRRVRRRRIEHMARARAR